MVPEWQSAISSLKKAKDSLLATIPNVDPTALSALGAVTKEFTTSPRNKTDAAVILLTEANKLDQNLDRLNVTTLGDLQTHIPTLEKQLDRAESIGGSHRSARNKKPKGSSHAPTSPDSKTTNAGIVALSNICRDGNSSDRLPRKESSEEQAWLDDTTTFAMPRRTMLEFDSRKHAEREISKLIVSIDYVPKLHAKPVSTFEAFEDVARLSRDATTASQTALTRLRAGNGIYDDDSDERIVQSLRNKMSKMREKGQHAEADKLRKDLGVITAGSQAYWTMTKNTIDTLTKQVDSAAMSYAEKATEDSGLTRDSMRDALALALSAQARLDLYSLRHTIYPLGEPSDPGSHMSKTALEKRQRTARDTIEHLMPPNPVLCDRKRGHFSRV
ncbi:hypothetical protein IAT40_007739 [Kwoniella sp. CBS 6097]